MVLGQGAKHPCATEVSSDLGHFSDWITHYLEISHPQHTLQSRATSTAGKVIKSVPKGGHSSQNASKDGSYKDTPDGISPDQDKSQDEVWKVSGHVCLIEMDLK